MKRMVQVGKGISTSLVPLEDMLSEFRHRREVAENAQMELLEAAAKNARAQHQAGHHEAAVRTLKKREQSVEFREWQMEIKRCNEQIKALERRRNADRVAEDRIVQKKRKDLEKQGLDFMGKAKASPINLIQAASRLREVVQDAEARGVISIKNDPKTMEAMYNDDLIGALQVALWVSYSRTIVQTLALQFDFRVDRKVPQIPPSMEMDEQWLNGHGANTVIPQRDLQVGILAGKVRHELKQRAAKEDYLTLAEKLRK